MSATEHCYRLLVWWCTPGYAHIFKSSNIAGAPTMMQRLLKKIPSTPKALAPYKLPF